MSQVTSYRAAGVDSKAASTALAPLFSSIRETWTDSPLNVELGHFASVVELDGVVVAIATDGVGTKVNIAQLMDRYDTVGIDCVAMNVNDVICVGARPVSMVDYLAVQRINPRVMAETWSIGLAKGARLKLALSIVGGETAQLPEIIRGEAEGTGLDLAATCIGKVWLQIK